MRKVKVILSIVLALVMLSTSFAFSTVVSAADVKTSETAQEANLQSNIEDGVILHALCWSYSEIEKNIPAIAAAGYSAVQTSPVQQPKYMSASTNVSGQWWKLYQPVSFSIANNSWVGTKDELTSLCNTAHKYGVKIVCDIVSNHLGANSEQQIPQYLAKEIKDYEPQIWNASSKGAGYADGNKYFHQDFSNASDGSNVTTGTVTKCPDLNTADSYIQGKVISLLKSCVDCGVDGFRFDAAKHIETPSDSTNRSNYWTNVLGQTNTYAASKGKTMFYYGEVLNTIGGSRNSSNYTNLNNGKFRITDNKASASIRGVVTGKNASGISKIQFNIAGSAGKSVLWAESHDTYLGNGDSESTTNISDSDIVKSWALVAARKDATALYFARTNNMLMGNSAVNTNYKSVAVAEVNKFHNNAVGKAEKVGSSGDIAYVARANTGVVLVNVRGTTANANVSGTGLASGTYTDMITGNKFTVNNGSVSGQIGSTGVAVVMQSSTTPTATASKESQTFEGETITTKLTLNNATSGTYQLDNYTPVRFTGSPTIRLGKDYNYGDTFTLTLTATDGTKTTTTKYTYTKKKAASSGVYIILPKSLIDNKSGGKKWTTPMYCYVYDEASMSSYPKYNNAAWAGEEMKYDPAKDVYYIEVHSDSCYKIASANSQPELVNNYDLAHSSRTRVIISDSAKSASGASQGNQFPATNGFLLKGTSHIYKQLMGAESSAWTTTTMVPGQETPVAATDVTKGDSTVPTDTTPSPRPSSETTSPSTETTPTQTTPPGKNYYGDANLDGNVNINDVTRIQQHLVEAPKLTDGLALELADVTSDGKVKIQDANYIQRKLAGLSNTGRVGNLCESYTPPVSTPETPETQETHETQATTPASTYTLYIKTQLTWISSMGSEPYVYDNSTGTSYQMIKDQSAYPEVFTAEVPESLTNVTFYRATGALTDPSSGYNVVTNLSVSKTNNCIMLTQPDSTLIGTTGPYVPEAQPSFSLSRIYVENDKSWPAVYIYGWGYGLNNQCYPMTNISGTNIWYYDLPQTIYGSTDKFFLLKPQDGTTDNDWSGQTGNLAITEPNNCYKLSGSWTTYSE